jgi:hypothetical protein
MNENFIFWIFGLSAIALLITVAGFVASRKLPAKAKKIRVRKFAAISIALMVLSFPIFRPFATSSSNSKYLDELKAEKLNSAEDFARFEEDQTRQIERLKEDVRELREDLYAVNLYYSSLTQFLSTMIAAAAVSFAFRKRKPEDDGVLEEIQPDQLRKL